MIASVIGDLVYPMQSMFFPGGILTFEDWQIFCDSMALGIVLGAIAGWAVYLVLGLSRLVPTHRSVFLLHRPYRWGIIWLWIVIFLWAILFLLWSAPPGKGSGYLNFNTFVMVVMIGLMAWLVYAVVSSLVLCHLPGMSRYRFVPYLNRAFIRRIR